MKDKYSIGDIVRIWDKTERDDSVRGPYIEAMTEYAGMIATITKVTEYGYYRLDVDGGRWGWVREMFDEDFVPSDAHEDADRFNMDDLLAILQAE